MIAIQLFVIIGATIIAGATLGNRGTHFGKAWKKIAIMLLALAMVVTVIFPNIVDYLARLMGVGRGTDLLLYFTVVAFILYVLNSYLYQQDQRHQINVLARKLAVLEANERYKDRLK